MDSEIQMIDLTPENIIDYGVCGYKDKGMYYPKGLTLLICPMPQQCSKCLGLLVILSVVRR